MDLAIPSPVRRCIELLRADGYAAYIVGGCVRDRLLGLEPEDWDVCTSAEPKAVKQTLHPYRILETGLRHGTVTAQIESMRIEITTFRRDGPYLDHRRPESVSFTADLHEDLARRDFTVNAMAYAPGEGLCDPFGGRGDLAARRLRCVGEADRRFAEDALRILRLFRFCSQLGFRPETQTLAAAAKKAALLETVSRERIAQELNRLLLGGQVYDALLLATDHGVLAVVIPEMIPVVGFSQNNPKHDRTLDRHIFSAVAAAPPDLTLRLALLLHDIGKPASCVFGKDGVGCCPGHDKVGASIARQVLTRLKYPNRTILHVCALIAEHRRKLEPDPVTLRRLLHEHGEEFTRQLIELRRCDLLAKGPAQREKAEKPGRVLELLDQVLAQRPCLSLSALAVRGEDLLGLGLSPGPEIGELLGRLLDLVLEDPALNEREILLREAQHLLSLR